MIRFIVTIKGIEEEKEYLFDQNLVKIGRLKENDISLPGGNISRQHCLVIKENTEYYINDTSSNGTYLNDQLVGRERKLPLRSGDKLGIGDFIVTFTIEEKEEEFEKTTDFLQKKFSELISQDTPPIKAPYALIVGGHTNGTKVELLKEMDEIMMGRTPDCHLQIPVPTVSKHHARLIKKGKKLELEDLSSANGTFLNGQQVSGVVELKDRDEIILGQKGILSPIKILISIPFETEEKVTFAEKEEDENAERKINTIVEAKNESSLHKSDVLPDKAPESPMDMDTSKLKKENKDVNEEEKAESQLLPQEITSKMGMLEYIIIGTAVFAVLIVVIILIISFSC